MKNAIIDLFCGCLPAFRALFRHSVTPLVMTRCAAQLPSALLVSQLLAEQLLLRDCDFLAQMLMRVVGAVLLALAAAALFTFATPAHGWHSSSLLASGDGMGSAHDSCFC